MVETVFLQALRDSGCVLAVDDNDAPAVFGTHDNRFIIHHDAEWVAH